MDTKSKAERSRNMALIKSKNTKPELTVRRLLFSLGYRYRLHDKNLPGKPDIVLKKYNTVILVHGCFWHHHKNCKHFRWPKSNEEYWIPKINRNVEKDKINRRLLRKLGWKTIVIWECETKDIKKLSKKLSTIKLSLS